MDDKPKKWKVAPPHYQKRPKGYNWSGRPRKKRKPKPKPSGLTKAGGMPVRVRKAAEESLGPKIKMRFLQKVYGQRLHPTRAALELGVPYETLLLMKEKDPELALAWKPAERGETLPAVVGNAEIPKNSLQLKHYLNTSLIYRAGVYDKIVAWATEMDPMAAEPEKRAEGREFFEMLIKNRFLVDLLPREAWSESTTPPPKAAEDDMDVDQLVEKSLKLAEKLAIAAGTARMNKDQRALFTEKIAAKRLEMARNVEFSERAASR